MLDGHWLLPSVSNRLRYHKITLQCAYSEQKMFAIVLLEFVKLTEVVLSI
jgi:hypothetical protein